MADRDFSKKFYRYWHSISYPGRRLYFPASQGRPQLEWDKIRSEFSYVLLILNSEQKSTSP